MKDSGIPELVFDYIVVGAGSSGCVVASRLSEDRSVSVLLIEAGPEDKSWTIDMPLAVEALVSGSRFNWQYRSEPETMLEGRQIDHPRGKVLGGSSSINGMVYTRGNPLDYDGWAIEFGCTGWGYADVLPYFKRSETFLGPSNEYRGRTGPLKVTRPDVNKDPLNRAFMEAGRQAGYPVSVDSNGFQHEGFHPSECTIYNGRRWSASRAFLSPDVRRRSNLAIYTGALVERIVIENKVAVGIELSRAGTRTFAKARREVVLCAGAFGSPQLLQLSGIGPSDVLQAANVDVVHELNGVGKNLQDHPDLPVPFVCEKPVGLGAVTRFPRKQIVGAQWFLGKGGLAASNQFEAAAYLRTKAGIKYPDLKLELLGVGFQPDSFKPYPGYSFQIHMTLLRAASRGHLAIKSNSAAEKPLIKFNYLSESADREFYRDAFRITRELVAQPAFSEYSGKELAPGAEVKSDDEIDHWVAAHIATAFHPSGTCRMGPVNDERTVVTPDLKVRGVANLRVADASIMPLVVASNTNAPCIMIGERAADLLRGRKLSPEERPYYVAPNWETSQR
ncbi:choline dehydrogenase [Paraburkholderia phymatum]|uniref:Glucose-methanol-choline oxidoreductase n=1 Tax=Paraburkholderia phymatum (strain DSM 17167 / CIP 108236 / LMG 21445 / STM815) TaxID=391038 RepID=B2JSF2_PARP8|nr:choline dehydrogenase [Paraburkholderia phymatum]ACC73972.1 glucose-methanol-choline oxidoreductase [Paraburkholderia phymatum STM815]